MRTRRRLTIRAIATNNKRKADNGAVSVCKEPMGVADAGSDAAALSDPASTLAEMCGASAISLLRLAANCPISSFAISFTRPLARPYWATISVRVKSVSTLTRVPLPSGNNVKLTTAAALPRPLRSAPFAVIRARRPAASTAASCASPPNCNCTGPSLTAASPLYRSTARTSVNRAPGRQGAILCTSRSSAQAASGGAAIKKLLSKRIYLHGRIAACDSDLMTRFRARPICSLRSRATRRPLRA